MISAADSRRALIGEFVRLARSLLPEDHKVFVNHEQRIFHVSVICGSADEGWKYQCRLAEVRFLERLTALRTSDNFADGHAFIQFCKHKRGDTDVVS